MSGSTIKTLNKAAKVVYAQGNYDMTFKKFFKAVKDNYNTSTAEEKRKAKASAKGIYKVWKLKLLQETENTVNKS